MPSKLTEVSFDEMLGVESTTSPINQDKLTDVSYDEMLGIGKPKSTPTINIPQIDLQPSHERAELTPTIQPTTKPKLDTQITDDAVVFEEALKQLTNPSTKEYGGLSDYFSKPVVNKPPELRAADPYEGVPRISANRDNSLASRFSGWWHTPNVSSAKATNIVKLSEMTGLTPTEVLRNYDELSAEVFPGSMPNPLKTIVHGGMTAGVLVGLAAHPLKTAAIVGSFMGLEELENLIVSKVKDKPYVFQQGLGLADLLDAEGLSRNALIVIDFLAKGALIGASSMSVRGLFGSIVKELKGKDKIKFVNKVSDKVVETGKSPDKVVLENSEELGVSTEALKAAHDKVVEIQKTQSELAAKDKVETPVVEDIVKEDLAIKGKQIKEAKKPKAKKAKKAKEAISLELTLEEVQNELSELIAKGNPEDATRIKQLKRLQKAMLKQEADNKKFEAPQPDNTKQGSKEPVETTTTVLVEEPTKRKTTKRKPKSESTPVEETISREQAEADLGKELVTEIETELGKPIEQTTKSELKKLLDKWEAEEVTELDVMSGIAREPEQLAPHSSPFRERDPKVTAEQRNLLGERNLAGNPEMLMAKAINDVNSYLDGVEGIDIVKVKRSISDFAAAARDTTNRKALLSYFDSDITATNNFIEMATEAAKWANRAERKPSANVAGTRLNMMIPIDEIPKTVMSLVKGANTAIDKLYRNKEIFQNTGFWLGRDGKWRYEVDDSKMSILPQDSWSKKVGNDVVFSQGITLDKLIDYPELFKAVPDLKEVRVEVGNRSGSGAYYSRNESLIWLDKIDRLFNKNYLSHEIQHAVNHKLESFSGSSPDLEYTKGKARLSIERLKELREYIEDSKTIRELDDIISKMSDGIETGMLHTYPGLFVNLNVANWLDEVGYSKAANIARKPIGSINDPIARYNKNPGEMESRVVEKRLELTSSQRRNIPPWETLDEMLSEERLDKDAGVKLYDIGGATAEGLNQVVKWYKSARAKAKEARSLRKFDLKLGAKLTTETGIRTLVDRSGNIKQDLLNQLSDEGYRIIQKLVLSKGASSLAADNLKQLHKEVFGGLTSKEKAILNEIIFQSRILDIAKYKTAKQFKELEKYTPEEAASFLELFPTMEGLTPEKAVELYTVRGDGSIGGRAGAYFDWMRKVLKDMYEAELISEKEFKDLSAHNYRRLKVVDIFDRKKPATGKKSITVYDSGVESLARGRDTTIFEQDAEVMALEVFNRAYGRIMNNRANKTLLELARNKPDNDFVRLKTKEGPPIPSGWKPTFLYEKGKKTTIYLSPKMAKEWISSSPEMSYEMSQLIRYASMSAVLRTFATGINWSFALANLPRDVMHAWYASRYYENGKWHSLYSPHLVEFPLQMAMDISSVFIDTALRRGRYKAYIDEGGGMEFLVHQGRLFRRGRHIGSPLDGLYNVLGYFGETSELLTRLAIRERALKKGKSPTEATFIARDYMDFGQGGGVTKAIDNAIPFLNASVQGTRGLARVFKPGSGTVLESVYKLSQFAAATTGLYIAMQKHAPMTYKNLYGSVDMQNNICIPLGDEFGFIDSEGQMRYIYFKIPLDPGQKFFKTFFEASADKWLGNKIDVDKVVGSLQQFSPVGTSPADILPPAFSGPLGYMTNKDFWLNEDIWRESNPFSYPNSAQEFTGNTPQAYRDFGELTGLSPERTKYAVEEVITSDNMWAQLMGKGYESLFSDMPSERKEQHIAMILAKTHGIKKFIGITNPYSKYASDIDKAQEQAILDEFVQNRNFDIKVEGYLYGEKGMVTRSELIKEANQYKDRDTYNRLMDRLKFEEAIKTLPEKSFWRRMKGLRLDARAKVFADRLMSSNDVEREQLWREYAIISKAGGVISPEFKREVGRYMNQR